MKKFSAFVSITGALLLLGCATSGGTTTLAEPTPPPAAPAADNCDKVFDHMIDLAVNEPSLPAEDRAAMKAGASDPARRAEFREQCKSLDAKVLECILAAKDPSAVEPCMPAPPAE